MLHIALCSFLQVRDTMWFGVIGMHTKHYDKYKKLGLNIAYYRKAKGYTQERLAEELDVDRTTISKIELAVSGVSLDLLFSISDLLDVPIQNFFLFRD